MMQPPPPPPPPPPMQEVMELNASSAAAQQKHQQMLLDLQAQRMASSMDVPTLPDAVRMALREIQCPVRVFGENLANVRDRLKLELAKRKVYGEHHGIPMSTSTLASTSAATTKKTAPEETQYTRATPAVILAREKIFSFALERSQQRLESERQMRISYKNLAKKRKSGTTTTIGGGDENKDTSNTTSTTSIADELDQSCCQMYTTLQSAVLAGSQYGDVRPLSAIATYNPTPASAAKLPCVLTASWSATLQWWDGSSPTLDLLGRHCQAHEDRIMGVAVQEMSSSSNNKSIMAGTASIDLTAKLWTISDKPTGTTDDDVEMGDAPSSTTVTNTTKNQENSDDSALPVQFTEVAHLKGHASRLCRIAFHPLGDWVATTSHDHTWRLWDIETSCTSSTSTSTNATDDNSKSGAELLLQDGHAREVFGIDFHPDGSLCATTDYSGMIHVWDLRTGKTAMQYCGHAGRVLCAKFAPVNGFQLTTAGDDGCLKVWDLRHRRRGNKKGGAGIGAAPEARRTIPAHSKLISHLEYADNDECLVSSSFDGTAKVWSTRGDWKLLQTLEGHEGKVMGLGIVATYDDTTNAHKQKDGATKKVNPKDWGIVTCGFDKTLKLWK